ncbi:MAG TPA: hypothetical protein VMD59_20450, partial [Acidimicrobiales bacterium]|nr:hypothetical protein [Acidimicrobiales bacterium]
VTLGADGDFSYEALVARYNADLANNLGNLLSRVATVVASKCGGIGPAPAPAGGEGEDENRIARCAGEATGRATQAWARCAPHEALEAAMLLVHETNHELEVNEPWKLPPGPEVEAVLGDALEAIRIIAILVSPAMPRVAQEIWERIGLDGRVDEPGRGGPAGGLSWGVYPGGLTVTKGEPLFPRRRAEEVAEAEEPEEAGAGALPDGA